MKLFVVIVLIVAGLGGVAFFVYREAYVSTDFKEKAELAIDALDIATTKVSTMISPTFLPLFKLSWQWKKLVQSHMRPQLRHSESA